MWDELEDGSKLWRLGIESEGALSINLKFSHYKLPKGATLFIYNIDKSHVIGGFTEFNNQTDGVFATTLVNGDRIIIEYHEPANVDFDGELILDRVTHGYRGVGEFNKGFGSSGSCNMNVMCDDGNPWADQIRSVGMLVSGGSGFCTGALINNTSEDGEPYFLTADHCYSNPSSWVFWFNWQSETCFNGTFPAHDDMSGATLKARNDDSDFCLVLLNSTPPADYGVYYAGWDNSDDQPTTQVGIHHPSGDIKKISFDDDPAVSSDYDPSPYLLNSHWEITDWDRSTTTEPGSSGSPLFDQNQRIIGQLHGGWASCSSYTEDFYGKFSMSWDRGSNSTMRLKEWLDPTNTGAETIDGYDPNNGTCDAPTNQATNFSSSNISNNKMTINWDKGNGDKVLVLAHESSAVDADPTVGSSYSANNYFGYGNEIDTENYVVYDGTETNVEIFGLAQGTTYHFAIYEYFSADNCYNTDELSGNATTTGAQDIQSISDFDVKIYPNPTTGKFSIEFEDFKSNYKILIFDKTGRTVYYEELKNKTNQIDVEHLSQGVYLIKIFNQESIKNTKIIIK